MFSSFTKTFLEGLGKYASLKSRKLRRNWNLFMKKKLSKGLVIKSKTQNKDF